MAEAPPKIDREQMRYVEERIANIARDRESLVDEFLAWLPRNNAARENIADVYLRWTKIKWPYVDLTTAERDLLLHYITHTSTGKVRILLANRTQPDKFTGATEGRPELPNRSQLARMAEGGDLARRPDESSLEYMDRLNAATAPRPVVAVDVEAQEDIFE